MDNNFSEKDLAQIINEIIEIGSDSLSEDSVKNIKEKIKKVKRDIQILIKNLEMAKNTKNREHLTSDMKNAYSIIMKFRTLILGEDSKIQYRLYLRGDDLNDVKIIDIDEEHLMKITERSGDSLRLKRNFLAIENIEANSKAQLIFDLHFKNVSKSFKFISGNNYVVPIENIQDLHRHPSQLENLYWQKDNGRGKSAYSPKFFNRGWIYQAFDETVYNEYKEKKEVKLQTFRESYFIKHLKYDNIIAFKGGDVGLNQIKSNMANLINLHSLIVYLNDIQKILDPESFSTSKQLADYIKEKFVEDKNFSESVGNYINNQTESLFKVFTNIAKT